MRGFLQVFAPFQTQSPKNRSRVPDLDKQLTELHYQVKEDGETLEEGLEDTKYVLYNDMTYNWRAFRVAHQRHLNLFESVEIDAQRPGKTLLMAWREDKRKREEVNEEQVDDSCQEKGEDESRADYQSQDNVESVGETFESAEPTVRSTGESSLQESIADPLIPAKRQPMDVEDDTNDQMTQKRPKI